MDVARFEHEWQVAEEWRHAERCATTGVVVVRDAGGGFYPVEAVDYRPRPDGTYELTIEI